MSVSTQDMRDAWAPPCSSSRLITIDFGTAGARITVDRRCVPAFMLLAAIMARHRYAIRKTDTGAYNCRQITGGSGYSLHAYGICVDVNWQSNPYGPTLITNMPPEMIREIEALRTNSGHVLFRWGGRYSSSKDAMHFELVVTPAQLATGIRGGDMPLNADDVATIREIVKNQVDEAELVARNQGVATREATIDYLDALARELGADPAKIRSHLKPKTVQILAAVD